LDLQILLDLRLFLELRTVLVRLLRQASAQQRDERIGGGLGLSVIADQDRACLGRQEIRSGEPRLVL